MLTSGFTVAGGRLNRVVKGSGNKIWLNDDDSFKQYRFVLDSLILLTLKEDFRNDFKN